MKKLTREQVGNIFGLAVEKAYFWEKEGREEVWPDAVFAAIQELAEGEEEERMKLTEARLVFRVPGSLYGEGSLYVEANYDYGTLNIGFNSLPTEKEAREIERQIKEYLKEMGAELDEA